MASNPIEQIGKGDSGFVFIQCFEPECFPEHKYVQPLKKAHIHICEHIMQHIARVVMD